MRRKFRVWTDFDDLPNTVVPRKPMSIYFSIRQASSLDRRCPQPPLSVAFCGATVAHIRAPGEELIVVRKHVRETRSAERGTL